MRSAPQSPVRELLRRYARAWLASLPAGADARLVDAFAGRDHPQTVGSEPATVRAIGDAFAWLSRRGSAGRAGWLLLEEDPVKVEWLRAAARAAGLREGEDVGGVVVEEDTPEGAGLSGRFGEVAHLLYLLDPPRPEQLPRELVETLLAAPGADLVVRLPTGALRRLVEHLDSTLADLPPLAKRAVDGWSRLLGDPRRGWFTAWREAVEGRGVEAAVEELVGRYASALRAAGGPARWVGHRRLVSRGADAAEYVVLSCTEPARVLLVNGVLHELRQADLLPWPEEEDDLVRHRPTGVIELFGGGGSAEQRERVADPLAIAHAIARRFAGRTVEWRHVVAGFLDTELHEEELRRAVLELRREGRALFRSLADPGTEVAFPRGARRPTSRRRGTRGGGDLTLPLDGPE